MKFIHEPPGEWHVGFWMTDWAISIRLLKWAFIWERR